MRGGLRTRLIGDSARLALVAGLEALGWFDPTVHDTPPGSRQHRPLRYIPRPVKWDERIEPNAIAITTEESQDDARGLGAEVEDHLTLYIDVLAQSDPLGWHIASDIRDLALGKMPSAGRQGPLIDVYDLRQATPSPFTTVDVDDIVVDRAENVASSWQDHWFMVRMRLTDEYLDEYDAAIHNTAWNEDLAPAWQRIQEAEAQGPP